MSGFENFNLPKPLFNAIDELGFDTPTPIQEEAFPMVLSGKDMVGIAQTGTGKTLAYVLPILKELKFSRQINPRILILVPTRELVVQVVERIEELCKYMNVRTLGVYGGVNINTHSKAVAEGADIVVATPGRLYDLTVSRAISLKSIYKLVIDEVDVMLDLGFRPQLTNIFDLLPERRQNAMFSATMTDDVEALIDDYFITPQKISIAVSGTPLDNISQSCYAVKNFYTKANLLKHLLLDREEYQKVLVFVSNKRSADRLFNYLEEVLMSDLCVIHSNKTQNYRLRSIEQFEEGIHRILITTDVMARGLDLDKITHVFNFDTPRFAENYMHRIGRTGRAKQQGKSVLFYTEKEEANKRAIERLMNYSIPEIAFPEEVEISSALTPDERPKVSEMASPHKKIAEPSGDAFHEKKAKNKKVNLGGSYKRELAKKYKKPKTRGDKGKNRRRRK